MLCGIDEAGRGCLAGPLFMAGCILKNEISGLNDSKKLTSKKREELYELIIKNSHFKIVNFSNYQIDKFGLSKCLKLGLEEIILYFSDLNCEFLYDGNTTFGVKNLKTLIKADALVKEVSAASILAKVSRDRIMMKFDEIYPNYGFKNHKGYGSKHHIQNIKNYGYCEIHRKSFKIRNLETKLINLFD